MTLPWPALGYGHKLVSYNKWPSSGLAGGLSAFPGALEGGRLSAGLSETDERERTTDNEVPEDSPIAARAFGAAMGLAYRHPI